MVTKKIKKLYITYIYIKILMSTIVAHSTLHALAPQAHKSETWVNIFVHGIISAAPVLSFETMYQIKTDSISDTLYEYYVQNARSNSFFHKNQTMQTIGLHKIDICRTDADDGSPATAKIFDMQYAWIY